MNLLYSRLFWGMLTLSFLILECVGYFFFQKYLHLSLCEYCAYIRFALLILLIASTLVTIYPKHIGIRIIGYIIAMYGIIQGLLWTYTYYTLTKSSPLASSLLCNTVPHFPLNLPLHYWFPDFFFPIAPCKEEIWRFFGFSMSEWLLFIFGVYMIFYIVCILTELVYLLRKRYSIQE